MLSTTSNERFFGVDYRALWTDVKSAWRNAQRWPLFSWVESPVAVKLLRADGSDVVVFEGKICSKENQSIPVRFFAVELPEDQVLRRNLTMPMINDSDMERAVALDVSAVSPFETADLDWAYSVTEVGPAAKKVEVVLASRKQARHFLEAASSRIPSGVVPELWVLDANGSPIALTGYGDGARKKYVRQKQRVVCGLLLLIGALLVAITVTPTVQLRARAIEAVKAYDIIYHKASPAMKQREALMTSADKLTTLNDLLTNRMEPLRIFETLTRVLPDDTAIQNFKLNGTKVTIIGLTNNASTLMQILGAEPGFKDVKAPSAATKMSGAVKEAYVIEFNLDPQIYGVSKVGDSAKPSVKSGSDRVSSSVNQSEHLVGRSQLGEVARHAMKAAS